jgi:hypothetical protein
MIDFGYTKLSMVQELEALCAITEGQLAKLAAEVTKDDAKRSLKRLKGLDASAPTLGELGRGAAVGSVVMPLSSLAWRAIAGPKGRVAGPKGPGQLWPGMRPTAATAAQGAVLGSFLPAGRHKLEQEAEKQKLREYVGHTRRGTLRGRVRKYTGI